MTCGKKKHNVRSLTTVHALLLHCYWTSLATTSGPTSGLTPPQAPTQIPTQTSNQTQTPLSLRFSLHSDSDSASQTGRLTLDDSYSTQTRVELVAASRIRRFTRQGREKFRMNGGNLEEGVDSKITTKGAPKSGYDEVELFPLDLLGDSKGRLKNAKGIMTRWRTAPAL